jgi:hypothetical protein
MRKCRVADRGKCRGVIARVMSNAISHLKARYCRSIMNTASISPEIEARHLIDGLATELPTSGASPAVAAAERDAYECIHALADRLTAATISGAALEWAKARKAVLRWIETCANDHHRQGADIVPKGNDGSRGVV